MKRFLPLLLVIVLIVGCRPSDVLKGVTKAVHLYVQESEDFEDDNAFSLDDDLQDLFDDSGDDELLSQLEFTEYKNSDTENPEAYIMVKNNSDSDIYIIFNITEYGSDGDIVNFSEEWLTYIESGTEAVATILLYSTDSTIEYDVTVEEEEYECIGSTIDYEITLSDDKAVVSATNTLDRTVSDVFGTALFYKGDEVVASDWEYFSNDEFHLKAGETINRELYGWDQEFDSVKIWFTGYIDGSSMDGGMESAAAYSGSDALGESGYFDEDEIISQLEITEYQNSDPLLPETYLIIKNNSEFNVDVTVDMLEYDGSGGIMGVSEGWAPYLESKSEGIIIISHDEMPDSYKYELSVEEEYDACVSSDITYETAMLDDKIVVSATNNSLDTAHFVVATAVFFKGTTSVASDWEYFEDADIEFKAGDTIHQELSSWGQEFDSVKVCFTATRY